MTEDEILAAVERFFDALAPCGMLRQFAVGSRRIDAMIVTDRGYRVAIEAKSTTADYRSETDDKRAPTEAFANTCWYAAPPGVIDPETLPHGWGLLEVDDPETVRLVRQPIAHNRQPTPADVANLLWRTWHTERRADEPGSVGHLRGEIETLRGRLAYAHEAQQRERSRAKSAAEFLAAVMGEQRCGHCEGMLRYHWIHGWTHAEKAREPACGHARAEAVRQERQAATGAAYALAPPPKPTPAILLDPVVPPDAKRG